jgi:hypothetical protein
MRTIIISAALSAGLIASQAMAADQGNWVENSYGSWGVVDIIWAGSDRVCRVVVYDGIKYPGGIDALGCRVSKGGGIPGLPTESVVPSYTYDVLVPAQKSASAGAIPTNATNKGAHGIGKFGNPGAPLYFCRADLGEEGKGEQLGSLAPASRGCLIPYGGSTKLVSKSYDVLVDLSPYKLPLTTANVSGEENIPLDALAGGYDTDYEPLFYCQATYNNAVVPGKTRRDFKVCLIPWQNSEIPVNPYQVLVPLWKDISVAKFTFPAWTERNGEKIHVCRHTSFSGRDSAGRYDATAEPNWCELDDGSGFYKPFLILSE